MQHLKSLRLWLHGLSAAVIGGAVTTLGAIPSIQFDSEGLKTLRNAALTGAFVGVVAYLKQSPLPCDPAKDSK